MRVINISKNTLIGDRIDIARTEAEKRLGLIPRFFLQPGQGLIIDPCIAIHMYYMKFPIDVLFVNPDNQIVYIIENIKPWQVSRAVNEGRYVVELPIGTVRKSNTRVGDRIALYER